MTQNFRTYNLAQDCFRDCSKLKLKSYLKDQLERASLSVCLNLVEGSAKRSDKERKRFYDVLGAYLYKLSH